MHFGNQLPISEPTHSLRTKGASRQTKTRYFKANKKIRLILPEASSAKRSQITNESHVSVPVKLAMALKRLRMPAVGKRRTSKEHACKFIPLDTFEHQHLPPPLFGDPVLSNPKLFFLVSGPYKPLGVKTKGPLPLPDPPTPLRPFGTAPLRALRVDLGGGAALHEDLRVVPLRLPTHPPLPRPPGRLHKTTSHVVCRMPPTFPQSPLEIIAPQSNVLVGWRKVLLAKLAVAGPIYRVVQAQSDRNVACTSHGAELKCAWPCQTFYLDCNVRVAPTTNV